MCLEGYHIPKLQICHASCSPPLTHECCFRLEETIKRSRFVTSIGHANNKETAKLFIQHIRAEFHDATHNCYAFAVGPPKDTTSIGQSDDGEPHATAGSPMLDILLYGEIGEIVVVISRYFGGIKLGTGGLIRAYQSSTSNAIKMLTTEIKVHYTTLHIKSPYPLISIIHHILSKFDAKIMTQEFTQHAIFTIEVPKIHLTLLQESLTNASNGQLIFY